MSVITTRQPQEELGTFVWRLLIGTRLSFAVVGVCGGALLGDGLGAEPYGALLFALAGVFASAIATEEVRK